MLHLQSRQSSKLKCQTGEEREILRSCEHLTLVLAVAQASAVFVHCIVRSRAGQQKKSMHSFPCPGKLRDGCHQLPSLSKHECGRTGTRIKYRSALGSCYGDY